ncbi:Tex family protein, partial [Deferrisoma sp.]
QVARDLGHRPGQVRAVVELLAGGATIPFVARYRKEMTGSLDEVAIAAVWDRYAYLTELEARKATVLETIEGQGKLTDELRERIRAASTKQELEDLYLPYKPRRRTKADQARERGLEPLALRALAQEDAAGDPLGIASAFVDPGREVPTAEEALAQAGYIVAETVAHDPEARAEVRRLTWEKGVLRAEALPEKRGERTKFETYYDFAEPVTRVPSHRVLAVRRGEEEGVLRVWVEAPEAEILAALERRFLKPEPSVWREFVRQAIADAYRRMLAPSIEVDVRVELKTRADEAAIAVFSENLRHLLLESPAGRRRVVAIDPGFRTGCKAVALDEQGDLLEWKAIFPHPPQERVEEAREVLGGLIARHRPEFVVVGNGTAGRETEAFVRALLRDHPEWGCRVLMVSEAGASVYSASAVAREEFPDLDVSVRGAVSIGRRFQDPLAELVKIDPKSIGVGQYQHDVNQTRLKKALDRVVEWCVNRVGVDVNTASPSLLRYVAGVGEALARNIVAHRREKGPFRRREDLLEVPRLGPKAFEQAAGFLRITGGENPLDASAVHPERYGLVERMAADLGVPVDDLIGNDRLVDRIRPEAYVAGDVGLPTVRDILDELRKPGRDPREAFDPVRFDERVQTLDDLKEGMELPGVVTNVTRFGAFVDVGVHQDGLVHVSELADRYVEDPAQVVRVGQKVRVRVLGVDRDRGRISLSMRSDPGAARPKGKRRELAADDWKAKLAQRYRVRPGRA